MSFYTHTYARAPTLDARIDLEANSCLPTRSSLESRLFRIRNGGVVAEGAVDFSPLPSDYQPSEVQVRSRGKQISELSHMDPRNSMLYRIRGGVVPSKETRTAVTPSQSYGTIGLKSKVSKTEGRLGRPTGKGKTPSVEADQGPTFVDPFIRHPKPIRAFVPEWLNKIEFLEEAALHTGTQPNPTDAPSVSPGEARKNETHSTSLPHVSAPHGEPYRVEASGRQDGDKAIRPHLTVGASQLGIDPWQPDDLDDYYHSNSGAHQVMTTADVLALDGLGTKEASVPREPCLVCWILGDEPSRMSCF
ncbi:hypothetical protein JAAARDRAFT_59334 [Jaapia argillacea MUCL 33604]|uniref:Uncharacterized protein n=1 Tax=Jaapia argillacea MUCL 33604 TaxID=933084 RepID=A0A067PNU6_9AGAM|nr:hypothetical protein JAAARDRAFT_59334 [Jaapia argillacea MUCL 33604]